MKAYMKNAIGLGLLVLPMNHSFGQETLPSLPESVNATTTTKQSASQEKFNADQALEEIRRVIAKDKENSEGRPPEPGARSDLFPSSMGFSGRASGMLLGASEMESSITSPETLEKQRLGQSIRVLNSLLESKTLTPSQQEGYVKKLRSVLEEYFQADMTERVREFDRVKSQMVAMENRLKSRLRQKGKIVDFQVKQILFGSEGLDTSLPNAPPVGDVMGYGRKGRSDATLASGPSLDGRETGIHERSPLSENDLMNQFGYDVGFGYTGILRQNWAPPTDDDPLKFYATQVNSSLPAEFATDAEALKAIMHALHQFLDRFEHLPRSQNRLLENQPPHSWRVAILPLIGHAELFQLYNFDEPWDSQDNLKIASKMPAIYRSRTSQSRDRTPYLMMVGNGAVDSGASPATFGDITDGTSNTIGLIASSDEVVWTKPEDCNFSPTGDTLKHAPSRVVALMDGSVQTVKESVPLQHYIEWFTRSGGEHANYEVFE